eukprot:2970605-Prymnesium_polylepis.1
MGVAWRGHVGGHALLEVEDPLVAPERQADEAVEQEVGAEEEDEADPLQHACQTCSTEGWGWGEGG